MKKIFKVQLTWLFVILAIAFLGSCVNIPSEMCLDDMKSDISDSSEQSELTQSKGYPGTPAKICNVRLL